MAELNDAVVLQEFTGEQISDLCDSETLYRYKSQIWNALQRESAKIGGPVKCGGFTFQRCDVVECLMGVYERLEKLCSQNQRVDAVHCVGNGSIPCGPCGIDMRLHFSGFRGTRGVSSGKLRSNY